LEYLKEKRIFAQMQLTDSVHNAEIKYVDFNSVHAGKGKALEYLAKKFNYAMEDTYCFGDSLNDVPMLLKAGTGILVKNSQKDLVNWFKKLSNQEKKNLIFSDQEHAYSLLWQLKQII